MAIKLEYQSQDEQVTLCEDADGDLEINVRGNWAAYIFPEEIPDLIQYLQLVLSRQHS